MTSIAKIPALSILIGCLFIAAAFPFLGDPRTSTNYLILYGAVVAAVFFMWIIWPWANIRLLLNPQTQIGARQLLDALMVALVCAFASFFVLVYLKSGGAILAKIVMGLLVTNWLTNAIILARTDLENPNRVSKIALAFFAQYFLPIGAFYLQRIFRPARKRAL